MNLLTLRNAAFASVRYGDCVGVGAANESAACICEGFYGDLLCPLYI